MNFILGILSKTVNTFQFQLNPDSSC